VSPAVTILPVSMPVRAYLGDDVSWTVNATTSLVGATVLGQVYDANAYQAQKRVVLATLTTTVAGQVITVAIPAAVSDVLPPVAWWDVSVTTAAGLQTTQAAGPLRLVGSS
jgi:hypothetical protein